MQNKKIAIETNGECAITLNENLNLHVVFHEEKTTIDISPSFWVSHCADIKIYQEENTVTLLLLFSYSDKMGR